MEWPYRRFIKAFDAFQRRLACDYLRTRKIAHVAALYANSNWDAEDNPRIKAIAELEHTYEELITEAWNGSSSGVAREEEPEPAFMQAGRRAVAAMTQRPAMPGEKALQALPTNG
jgi:hypothetical protein